ncbi:MAG TPA: N-acetylmuramoyl-L-alanine amidase CwlD [Lachnospiraceae bacterium]|nr:N-acetylmuramoyl-L-alanine amidase CwlD [Lachnospiraceae bacterium]
MRHKNIVMMFFLFVIMVCVCKQYKNIQSAVNTMLSVDRRVIVIDAGHGGWDPGKAGTTGKNEKDLNLEIAKKLQMLLETGGATVIIIREEDEALGESKRKDMKERKATAEEAEADMLISIHQNSFPQAGVKGAQVFYYNGSEEGKKLSEYIQARLKSDLDNTNQRQAKANTDYYILKNILVPTALVECGFLSNSNEEALLNTEGYQQKVAWSIYLGIEDYFEACGKN